MESENNESNKIQQDNQFEDAELSEICELNEKNSLIIIKKRLIALNSLDTNNDLNNLNEVSAKYNINQEILLEDYFGIQVNDLIKLEENELKLSLEKKLKDIVSNLKIKSKEFLIPNALISIKHRVPFIFVNKLALYLSRQTIDESDNNNTTNLDDDEDIFIQNLVSNYINLYSTLKLENVKNFEYDKLNRLLKGY